MNVMRGARERAREEITEAIKDEARRQLAESGAAGLSLRAVARELGMASSALYRYYPSRDHLLTALIVDAYGALGAAAEYALAALEEAPAVDRWRVVCHAVRDWALDHPHEYALIYGSPVPGYAAPQETTGPAARVALCLITVVVDAEGDGELRTPDDGLPPEVGQDAAALGVLLGISLPAPVLARLIAAWSQLFGLVGFELFGQFTGVVKAREAFFDHAVTRLAESVGLT
ncbi:TetR/AcrR family transcriptional regulator [Streptomyces sp. 549]|uniref:TetR/AcrR family transcriptional regulator n=1 Tax=Streptomyces sp. 549 TaxID=3049076 RepID=UPI0024C46EA4|nr:TetR/AcrR family transcriptional regulator [Streptomyces sp. 549]MDK1474731.1 TetR/AcrR family transcriptional regulator [Streptomyces sp. 549]